MKDNEILRTLRSPLERLSRKNRRFFDSLVRHIYGDIRLPLDSPLRSTYYDDWMQTELPWWVDNRRKAYDLDSRTISEVLTERQIKALGLWMTSHTCHGIKEGRIIMHELFNDCDLVALNPVEEIEDMNKTL